MQISSLMKFVHIWVYQYGDGQGCHGQPKPYSVTLFVHMSLYSCILGGGSGSGLNPYMHGLLIRKFFMPHGFLQ